MTATGGPTRGEPVVLALSQPLTRAAAEQIAHDVDRADSRDRVVIDLTAIPSFDSDGARVLLDLQDMVGADRLSIVGFRQAAARLMGVPDGNEPVRPDVPSQALRITRLQNTAVVRATGDQALPGHVLESALAAAIADDVAIVVVDFKDAGPLPQPAVEALTFASSEAALRGRELLVVNITAEDATLLRRSGLSATTFVAPESLD